MNVCAAGGPDVLSFDFCDDFNFAQEAGKEQLTLLGRGADNMDAACGGDGAHSSSDTHGGSTGRDAGARAEDDGIRGNS